MQAPSWATSLLGCRAGFAWARLTAAAALLLMLLLLLRLQLLLGA